LWPVLSHQSQCCCDRLSSFTQILFIGLLSDSSLSPLCKVISWVLFSIVNAFSLWKYILFQLLHFVVISVIFWRVKTWSQIRTAECVIILTLFVNQLSKSMMKVLEKSWCIWIHFWSSVNCNCKSLVLHDVCHKMISNVNKLDVWSCTLSCDIITSELNETSSASQKLSQMLFFVKALKKTDLCVTRKFILLISVMNCCVRFKISLSYVCFNDAKQLTSSDWSRCDKYDSMQRVTIFFLMQRFRNFSVWWLLWPSFKRSSCVLTIQVFVCWLKCWSHTISWAFVVQPLLLSQVRNETDAQLIISKYKKNTIKRKRRASYRSKKIMCFSLRVLVSN